MAERLQKLIAASGYTSRRKAEQLILDGKVSVNGEVVKELGVKAEPSDIIIVEGVRLLKRIRDITYSTNQKKLLHQCLMKKIEHV